MPVSCIMTTGKRLFRVCEDKTARKIFKTTEQKIQNLLAQGRGQGEGAAYQPWLQIGDFSSKGRGHRIQDHRTGRIHHLFSDLEARYYYILAWSDNVLDIREQFPLLPRTQTEEIAAMLGYAHPKSPGGSCNEIMTTDFLLTVKDPDANASTHLEARYVKYTKDLSGKRTCEKLEIERAFGVARNVPFKVVTEKSIDIVKAKNIEKLLGHYAFPTLGKTADELAECSKTLLLELIDNPYQSLSFCVSYLDRKFAWNAGEALNLFFHLSARKVIPLHMENKLLPTQPVEQLVDIQKLQAQIDQERRVLYVSNPA